MKLRNWLARVVRPVVSSRLNNATQSRRSTYLSRRLTAATLETLEDRALLSSISASLVNGDLTISDSDATGKNNFLSVSVSGSNLVVSDSFETFIAAPSGGVLSNGNTTLTIPLASVTGTLTIDGGKGTDNISINALNGLLGGLSVNGGEGDDSVTFNGDITFATNASLDVDLQNDAATPGVDQVTVNNDANLVLSGTGPATMKVSKSIQFNPGSSLITANGNLTL